MLIYVFGQVFGINRKDSGPTGIRLAVINESSEPAAQQLVAALAAEKAFRLVTNSKTATGSSQPPFTEDDVRAMMRDNQLRFGVVIPRDLIRQNAIGVRLKILPIRATRLKRRPSMDCCRRRFSPTHRNSLAAR
ncbi:MAG: hypothetical protein ABIQ35_10535 [Verrucomicrobiota bacterium]